jgi:hypothetical protein
MAPPTGTFNFLVGFILLDYFNLDHTFRHLPCDIFATAKYVSLV